MIHQHEIDRCLGHDLGVVGRSAHGPDTEQLLSGLQASFQFGGHASYLML
jgi:hypothetical protein